MVPRGGIEPPTRGFSIPALPTELSGQIRLTHLRFVGAIKRFLRFEVNRFLTLSGLIAQEMAHF